MRLNQYVSKATGLSRRAADTEISAGHVAVDDHLASLGVQVEEGAVVTLNGRSISLPANLVYVMLNKPIGFVASRRKQGSDPTIYDLLPSAHRELRPVGRLDKDSSGLLLLTNDGDFIQRFTHPSHLKTKTYELVLTKPLSKDSIGQLSSSVNLPDGPSHLTLTSANANHVTITMLEGRNRQIRRTLGAIGYGIASLHRTTVGPYSLDGLEPGKWQVVERDTAS